MHERQARLFGRAAALTAAAALPIAACGLDVVGSAPATSPPTEDASAAPAPTTSAPTVDADALLSCTPGDGGGCAAWAACEAGRCVDVARSLVALRQQLPCGARYSYNYCDTATASPADVTALLTGSDGASYALAIRIRGVLEQKTYEDATVVPATGINAAFFAQGGRPRNDNWNVAELRVTAPDFTWHLNRGSSDHAYSDPLDYRTTITAAAGASVVLRMSSQDTRMARGTDSDRSEIPVDGLPVYDGQYFQLDVESVTRR